MVRPSLLVGALVLLTLSGCGGSGGGGSKSTKSVQVTSNVDTVRPGGSVAFIAIVQGGGKPTWSVDGGSANGTITAGGLYTAPATQGTYTIRATVNGLSSTKTVTVTTGVSIALTSPTTVPLTVPKSKLTFKASVTGSTNQAVNWTVTGQPGAIASDGTFTAPDAPGTYTVVGTSAADAQKTVSVNVQVVANVNVHVIFAGKGDVVFALRPDKAPNTVANYVTLVNKGFYNGIVIHRYEENFVVQWGDPLTKTLDLNDPSIGTGGPGYTIPFEENDLSNVKYSLAMARSSDKDSAGSQVYVNLADNTSLDHTDTNQGYVVFGSVASGQAVVDSLRKGDKIFLAEVQAATP